MEAERLIKIDHRGYCVMFPNYKGLTKDVIKEIFCKFGLIRSITETGDVRGYRFVRYHTFEQAKSAVEGLRGHKDIKLCDHNPRNPKYRESNNNDTSNVNKNERGFGYRHRNTSSSSDLCCSETSSVFEFKKPNNATSVSGNEPFLRPKSQSSVHSASSDKPKSTRSARYFEKRGNGGNDKEENMPMNTSNKKYQQEESKEVVINASEVIVGNIPADVSEAYFLHLFERYDPIAIGKMMTISNSGKRYLHVYFKDSKDAVAVERQFDKYSLAGKNLVVLRSSKLVLMNVVKNQKWL